MGAREVGLAGALIALVIGTAAAEAKPPPEIPADQPVIGDVNGLYGPGPVVAVHAGREWLFKNGRVWIEVYCGSSTDLGCEGVLTVADAQGAELDRTSFELPEAHDASVAIDLPRAAVRTARRDGLRLKATAEAVDSLGRPGGDSASITVGRPKR